MTSGVSGLVTITVTGQFVDLSDRPANGHVLLVPVNRVAGNGWIVVGTPVRVHIRNGIANDKMITNQAALSGDLYVRVTEQITGEQHQQDPYVVKPEGTTLNLTTAPRVANPPPGQLFVPASAVGQPGGIATLGPDGKLTASQRPPGGGGGVTSHHDLTGLAEGDDHPQYLLRTDAADTYAAKAVTEAALEFLADALADGLATKQNADPQLSQLAALTPGEGDVIQQRGGVLTSRTLTELRADLGDLAAVKGLKLYDVEHPDYGAVGDGTTDDFEAFRLAHYDMTTQGHLGALFCPRIAQYRLDLDVPGRLVVSPDKARAFFPFPMRARSAGVEKAVWGIVGVGEPDTERAAELGGEPTQVNTASAIVATYTGTFTWSPTEGLPCLFGGPDADMTDPVGNTFANIHLVVRNLILRNTANPSLTMVNGEQMSTMVVERLRIDVVPVLDNAPLCTHPTGGSILLPRSNNNTIVKLRDLLVVGHYTGVPFTEHLYAEAVEALRCTIGAFTRRPNSHPGLILKLLTEQCPWGIAGWNPAGEAPNLGVVDFHGWIGHIGVWGIEDYAYRGSRPDQYTPGENPAEGDPQQARRRAHVLNRNDTWGGKVGLVARVNSEPEPPTGIGVPPAGQSSSLYVRGVGGTTDTPRLALHSFDGTGAAQRLLGGFPYNPPTLPPDPPTIGTATAAIESAQVTFTPASTGPPATSYTATAYNTGNVAVGTATGTASPINIVGLAADVPVTIRVRASNIVGASAESASSNEVTPAGALGLPQDNYNRADSPGTLGVSSSGHAYSGNPNAAWGVLGQRAVCESVGTQWNPTWMDTGETDFVVSADVIHNETERGLFARCSDAENGYYLDLNFNSNNTATGRLYSREDGAFRPLGSDGFTLSGLILGQVVRLKLRFTGDTITAYANPNPEVDVQRQQVTDTTHIGTGAGLGGLHTPGADRATFDNLVTSYL